jgi:hypothetical protein
VSALKEAAEQVFGAMALVHTSAAAMRAVEAGEEVDMTSLRLTLQRAARELETAHSAIDAAASGEVAS